MGKTYRDRPAKERQIAIQKHERGDHRKMNPYNRKASKRSAWQDQDY